jgi:predicted ester cyclase
MAEMGALEVARLIYESVRMREFDRAADQVAEDAILLNVASGDMFRGRNGFLEYFRSWNSAVPDLRIQLLDVVGVGERAVAEYELSGTHTGSLVTPQGHIPPTAMEVQVRFCDVLEIRDGRCVQLRSYFDSATLLRQLGLVTASPLHAPERRAALELYAQAMDTYAPQRHKAVVHRFLQNVFNRQDAGAAADTCVRDFAWHGGPLGEVRGLGAYQDVLRAFFTAFPDLQIEPLDSVAEGDRVVVRFALSGTHRGEFQGIPATHRRVAGEGTSTFRIVDNRIAEEWWQADLLAILQQMNGAPSTIRLSP